MAHGNRVIRSKRKLVGVRQRAFDFDTINWIGPIENNHRKFYLRCFFHHVAERGAVGITPHPDVLNVVNNCVEVFQLFRLGSA